ncbi:MAG: hypothetical protein JNJ77_20180 [Planctomycetia bacterium]|nr:hypothetical protein [Planctomycetia bacterium]
MGWQIVDMPVFMLFLCFLPYVIVAATSWAVRSDAQSSWIALIVSFLVSGIGVGSWLLSEHLRAWGGAFIALFFFMPIIQFLVWFAGAIISGRRNVIKI